MSWFRCDDGLADHPKVMALDDRALPAMGLWLFCGVYCSKHLTDGFVPARLVKLVGGGREARDLVSAGLLEKVDGGYRMHDYLEWNPSRDEVVERRAERSASGKAGAKARWERESHGNSHSESHSISHGNNNAPVPVPVSQLLSSVLGNGNGADEDNPVALYQARARRKSVSQKERDWLEDLHSRFSRKELVLALRAVDRGPDLLKRVDQYLEHGEEA